MADGDHLNRIGWARSLLDAGDHPRSGHEQNHTDENRDDGPCQLHLIAAVNLRRLATVIVCPTRKSHDALHQQASHNHEYGSCNREPKKPETSNTIGRARDGRNETFWTDRT